MTRYAYLLMTTICFWLTLLGGGAMADEFPSLTQVTPRAGEIAADAVQARARAEALSEVGDFQEQIAAVRERLALTQGRIEQHGEPGTWSIERLLESRSALQSERARLQRLQHELTERYEEAERIRLSWQARKEYWASWEESLKGQDVQYPRETFAQVRQLHSEVLGILEPVAGAYSSVQEELSALLHENITLLGAVEGGLRHLRAQIFQRTGHPLFHSDFIAPFGEPLRDEFRQGIGEALRIDLRVFQGQVWILIAQVLLAFGAALFIERHRRAASEKSHEWDFMLSHPWATGIFVAMASFAGFFDALPALWNLIIWLLLAISAAVLISAMVRNPLKRFTVYFLTTVLLVSMVLQLIALPTPMYRIFIAGVSAAGIPAFVYLARYNFRRHAGQV